MHFFSQRVSLFSHATKFRDKIIHNSFFFFIVMDPIFFTLYDFIYLSVDIILAY